MKSDLVFAFSFHAIGPFLPSHSWGEDHCLLSESADPGGLISSSKVPICVCDIQDYKLYNGGVQITKGRHYKYSEPT